MSPIFGHVWMPANIRMVPKWQGATALQLAAYKGQEDVVRLLLERGANPQGAMRQATMMQQSSIIQILKRAGAHDVKMMRD